MEKSAHTRGWNSIYRVTLQKEKVYTYTNIGNIIFLRGNINIILIGIIMRRLLALVFVLTLLLSATPVTAINSPAVNVKGVRILVDGKVRAFDARLSGGNWYLKPADIEAALGVNVTATLNGYANLRDAARKANVSYEHDGVLNAAYMWTEEPYVDDASGDFDHASGDFDRAIRLGLVQANLKTNPDRQISAKEFRALLSSMVGRLVPGKVTQFEKNVKTSNKLLLRGEGFVMAYYAAICVGADTRNNDFDNSRADGNDFWDDSKYKFDQLFPHIWDGPVKFSNTNDKWKDYFAAAFLWSFWHSSPYSGYQVFEYDEKTGSMRPNQQLTVKEAVAAAVRIFDTYTASSKYLSLTDNQAVNYDKTIITDKLLSKAKSLPTVTKENMPVWKGFVLSNGGNYENTDIVESDKDVRNIADWGFNSVRIMLTYQTLFDKEVKSVNESNLKKLDALIAAAIRYNLHIDVLTFSLPGRWTLFDDSTYKTIGSLDLFTNPDRQKEANEVWALLSERYKDIPGAALSFCPIWEAQNHDLSSGLPVAPYTADDVAKVYSQMIDTIRKHDPDRFVIFETTANNGSVDIIKESDKIKDTIQSKYPDALMMANFCENPFVYAEMTAVQGENIDNNNHSMFKPAYPAIIYATQYHINNGSSLDMNGGLVAGTKLDIYLSKVDGTGNFEITADGRTLHSESLSTQNYKAEAPLSRFYPYAKSDKLVSVTLKSDVKNLQVSYGGNWFEWSGIDVTLPAKYKVKRWWFPSGYDAMLNGTDESKPLVPVLKDTSTIMLSPNNDSDGRTITINPDVTYTTPAIFAQSTKQTIEDWTKTMSGYSSRLIVRFESAGFDIGCTQDSALKYYGDLLSAFDKYGFGWYSNDYWRITHAEKNFYAGVKPVKYKDCSYFNAEMLKLLQKYQ
jgi:hypothetical protein